MAERLGNVLYWAGCIVAVAALSMGVLALLVGTESWPGQNIMRFIEIGGTGAIAYLIGRTCRYVLAGR